MCCQNSLLFRKAHGRIQADGGDIVRVHEDGPVSYTHLTGMGMNKFAAQAPVLIVISERSYNKTAALGSRVTKVDYRDVYKRQFPTSTQNSTAPSTIKICTGQAKR